MAVLILVLDLMAWSAQIMGCFRRPTTWSLDNWGEYLVACSPDDGKLYEWDFSGVAEVLANAPINCDAMLVTDERFIFAFGAGGQPSKSSVVQS